MLGGPGGQLVAADRMTPAIGEIEERAVGLGDGQPVTIRADHAQPSQPREGLGPQPDQGGEEILVRPVDGGHDRQRLGRDAPGLRAQAAQHLGGGRVGQRALRRLRFGVPADRPAQRVGDERDPAAEPYDEAGVRRAGHAERGGQRADVGGRPRPELDGDERPVRPSGPRGQGQPTGDHEPAVPGAVDETRRRGRPVVGVDPVDGERPAPPAGVRSRSTKSYASVASSLPLPTPSGPTTLTIAAPGPPSASSSALTTHRAGSRG